MADPEVRPALTPEEWARKCHHDECAGAETEIRFHAHNPDCIMLTGMHAGCGYTDSPRSKHALAALVLHGQPFGFTWDDVDALREVAEGIARYETSVTSPEDAGPLRDLADRIAALLPPR